MRGMLRTLAFGLTLALPLVSWAVATNVDVSQGGERVAKKRIQIVDTSSNQVVAETETDESGRATVDLAAGSYVARSKDGKHQSQPFQAGDTARLDLPARSPGGWSVAIDVGGGWSGMDSDTGASGNQVTEQLQEVQVQDPVFPDRFTVQQQLELIDNPFDFSSDNSVQGGFGGATLQLMGPPCGPCGVRPVFFGGFAFNNIESTLISSPAGSTGKDVELRVKRYPWQLGLGASWETPWWGIGLEGGVAYQNDRMRMTGMFNPKDSTTFNVHSIGPRINVTKRLMKWDKAELGVYAGVSVLFPFAGETETLTLTGSNGSVARFEYEAETLVTAGGGLRLAFDIPGL